MHVTDKTIVSILHSSQNNYVDIFVKPNFQEIITKEDTCTVASVIAAGRASTTFINAAVIDGIVFHAIHVPVDRHAVGRLGRQVTVAAVRAGLAATGDAVGAAAAVQAAGTGWKGTNEIT